jgi:Tfp pilus assembly pilus retraction ATPase PilT
MGALLSLSELLREAFANGAVRLTLRTGLYPVICSVKGVQMYDTQSSTSEDIEELLRQLVSSRKMRQFRAVGEIHFKSVFGDRVPILGEAKVEGDDLHIEIRKLSVQP